MDTPTRGESCWTDDELYELQVPGALECDPYTVAESRILLRHDAAGVMVLEQRAVPQELSEAERISKRYYQRPALPG